jgi:hypothetical protein
VPAAYVIYSDLSFTLEDFGPDSDVGGAEPNSQLLESTTTSLRPDDFEPPAMPSMEDAPGVPDEGYTPDFPSLPDDSDLMTQFSVL